MGKILNIFFIFFLVILFSLNQVLRIDLGNNIAITGIDIGVSILIVILLCNIFVQKEKKHFSLTKPILIFSSIGLLSLIFNLPHLKTTEFLVSFLYLLRWIIYAGLYFTVSSFPENQKLKIPFYMTVSGVVTLLLGFLQYFLYPNLRNLAYLGWDVHLYRMFGSFLDPNFFGAYLVLYFLFLLGFYTVGNEFKSFSMKNAILLLLSLLTLVGIVLTYSRSAYLMLVVGLFAFFLLQRTKALKKVFLISVIAVVICSASYTFFTKYSEGTNLLRVTSTKARIGSSENALIIFEKNPLFGVGFDAYRYAQKRYGFIQPSPQQAKIVSDHGAAGTDNSWLFVLATTGVIGFASYIYLWWSILKEKNHNSYFIIPNSILIASSVALFVDCFFVNSLFYPAIMVWMWILVGLSE